MTILRTTVYLNHAAGSLFGFTAESAQTRMAESFDLELAEHLRGQMLIEAAREIVFEQLNIDDDPSHQASLYFLVEDRHFLRFDGLVAEGVAPNRPLPPTASSTGHGYLCAPRQRQYIDHADLRVDDTGSRRTPLPSLTVESERTMPNPQNFGAWARDRLHYQPQHPGPGWTRSCQRPPWDARPLTHPTGPWSGAPYLLRSTTVHHKVGSFDPSSAAATAAASQPSRTASRNATARSRRARRPLSPRRIGTPAAAAARPSHHHHVVALGAAHDVQQADIAGHAHPHARRVVTPVQRAHPRRQRTAFERGGQCIPVRAHHDPRPAATNPEPTVGIRTHTARPDRAVLRSGTPHHVAFKTRQLLSMPDRIDDQL
jgi:hypothetical protein